MDDRRDGERRTLVVIFGPPAVGKMAVGFELERLTGLRLLLHKPPKRDVRRSRENLLEIERSYRLNSAGDFFYAEDHLRIDNTALAPQDTARRIVDHFGLAVLAAG